MYYVPDGYCRPGDYRKVLEHTRRRGKHRVRIENCPCGCGGSGFHVFDNYSIISDQMKEEFESSGRSFQIIDDDKSPYISNGFVYLTKPYIRKHGFQKAWILAHLQNTTKSFMKYRDDLKNDIRRYNDAIAETIRKLRSFTIPKLEYDDRIADAQLTEDGLLILKLKPLNLSVSMSVHTPDCPFYDNQDYCDCHTPTVRWPVYYQEVQVRWFMPGNDVEIEAYDADYNLQHPHISGGDFKACWGNLGVEAASAIERYDLPRFLDILIILLSSYNPDDTYHLWDLMMKETAEGLFFDQLETLTKEEQ